MSYGCRDCRDEIPARDAGSLTALAQARVDAHLAACADCRAFRARWSALLAAGRAWTPSPSPEDRDGFYGMVTPSTGSPAVSAPRWRRFVMAGASLAAAAGLAAVVVFRGADAPARPHDPASFESAPAAYDEAERLVEIGDVRRATKFLRALRDAWPRTPEAAAAKVHLCRLAPEDPVCAQPDR